MTGAARTGGTAVIGFVLAFVAFTGLEARRWNLTIDGDDPGLGVRFFREHSDTFRLSGIASFLMAVTLTVAALAVAEVLADRAGPVGVRSTAAFGLFAGAFFFANGALRMATGTVVYIDDLDHDWGLSAYLVVQIAGTQGLLLAGVLAFSTWAVGLSLLGARRRVFPRRLTVLGVFPACYVVGGLVGPLVGGDDVLWAVWILSVFGSMAWCLVLAVVLLRWGRAGQRAPDAPDAPALAR